MFEMCMTKFIDFNVFSSNFFSEPLPKLNEINSGTEVDPIKYPVLEEYIPEDKLM